MRRTVLLLGVLALTACSGGEAAEPEPVPTVTQTVTVAAPDPLEQIGQDLCVAVAANDAVGYAEAWDAVKAETGTSDPGDVLEALIRVHCPQYRD